MSRKVLRDYWKKACVAIGFVAWVVAMPAMVQAQQPSVSAWDKANFRIWGYIPYWATATDLTNLAKYKVYDHVSDVLYFGGVRPQIDGSLYYISGATTELSTIKSQAAANGFRLHMSMFEVHDPASNDDWDIVWEAIIKDPNLRNTFTDNLKNFLVANNMKGFNFDYERPNNVDSVTGQASNEWGNYTKLAQELADKIRPLGMETSVCDYGGVDTRWDDTADFDAHAYDQLFIMGYLYTASQNSGFATGHLNLAKGTSRAFQSSQLAIGVGTYAEGPSTIGISSIVGASPNLAYDAGSYTGTIGTKTGTWTFESRKQVREKTQVALDGGMAGMFSWTLHYDALNNMGLDRVMHHYAMVKRDIPDLNLDGEVDSKDGYALADSIGSALTNTGLATAAQMDAFYLNGNWEKGDHDGNGFVNQADADWLSTRFAALGVNIPDRLPFKGTFDDFPSSLGITGRWKAGRNGQGKLVETGNFKQELSNYMLWSSRGVGGKLHSNSFVTIRNQTSAESAAGLNSAARTMQADITTNIDLSQNQDTYVKFLVRENTAPLSAAQLASSNRTLSLDFLNSAGASQFDIAFRGLQHQFAIDSVADATGQDVSAGGFSSDTIYMLIAKISGNGSGANTMYASLFAAGDTIGNFTNSGFQWMLSAQGSAGFNPTITDIQFTSNAGANYTVSNVWIGSAATMLPSAGSGASADLLASVPEPTGLVLMLLGAIMAFSIRIR